MGPGSAWEPRALPGFVIDDRRIERLAKWRIVESVPRAVASVSPIEGYLREPRSLPLAVLIQTRSLSLAVLIRRELIGSRVSGRRSVCCWF